MSNDKKFKWQQCQMTQNQMTTKNDNTGLVTTKSNDNKDIMTTIKVDWQQRLIDNKDRMTTKDKTNEKIAK